MSGGLHLILQELTIGPSSDWMPGGEGWIMIRVAEGAGYWLRSGQGAGELNVGDGLVLGRDRTTQLRSSLLCPMRLQFFAVHPEYLGLLTVAEWQRFNTLAGSESYFLAFHADDTNGREFSRLARQAQGNELCFRCDLLHFWAGIVAGFLKAPAKASPEESRLRKRLREVLAQKPIVELSNCSCSDLALQLNCSLRHFRRLFREEFGAPFRSTQTELRLLHARQLLAESDSSVVAVAGECGYQHMSFFRSLFKKRFGMAPAQWRRQAQMNGLSHGHPSR